MNLLNNRRQQSQQMQFVQRLGSTQEGTTSKKSRTDLNEIQAPKKTSQVTIVEDNLFELHLAWDIVFLQIFLWEQALLSN